jgi:flotillin
VQFSLALALVGGFIVLVFMLAYFRMIAKSYVKAPANRAFVRTGGYFRRPDAPPKVIMNGGTWVFNFIHEITWVDLCTVPIEIEHVEQNALVTHDLRYADVRAMFYVKVCPTVEGIIDAARTVGGKVVDAQSIKQLAEAKLDGALCDVVATCTLLDLHRERENFINEVSNRVRSDLMENGLTLESISILTLKPAHQGSFGADDEVVQTVPGERGVEAERQDINIVKENLTL